MKRNLTTQKTKIMATAKQIELGLFIAPLTELVSKMIIAGVLKKNVIKYFTNKGLPFEVAEMITECGIIKAENFMFYKSK